MIVKYVKIFLCNIASWAKHSCSCLIKLYYSEYFLFMRLIFGSIYQEFDEQVDFGIIFTVSEMDQTCV